MDESRKEVLVRVQEVHGGGNYALPGGHPYGWCSSAAGANRNLKQSTVPGGLVPFGIRNITFSTFHQHSIVDGDSVTRGAINNQDKTQYSTQSILECQRTARAFHSYVCRSPALGRALRQSQR